MKTENNYLVYVSKVWFAAFLLAPLLYFCEELFLKQNIYQDGEFIAMKFIYLIFSIPAFILINLIAQILSKIGLTEKSYRILIAIFAMIFLSINLWVLSGSTLFRPTFFEFLLEIKFHLILIFVLSQIFELKINSSKDKKLHLHEDILDEKLPD